ncbi:hypothetical protein TNIN_244551 [Trichonephila inaurata madagascariensis]|uniref:Uncharacterized protein n=1 Tax=Trichonephila inaurata madagascariensis TaxID=2747483 RepID=A0A8X7C332_9ARAC|nr:hypothetical protein TNIN_244551 [Trichonephila inaurata madagascariensis]
MPEKFSYEPNTFLEAGISLVWHHLDQRYSNCRLNQIYQFCCWCCTEIKEFRNLQNSYIKLTQERKSEA